MKVYVVMKDDDSYVAVDYPSTDLRTELVDIFDTRSGAENFINTYELTEEDTAYGRMDFEESYEPGEQYLREWHHEESSPVYENSTVIGLYIIEKEVISA